MVWVITVPYARDACPANTALLRENLVSLDVQSLWLVDAPPAFALQYRWFAFHKTCSKLDASVESETIHLSSCNSVYAAKQSNLCHITSKVP